MLIDLGYVDVDFFLGINSLYTPVFSYCMSVDFLKYTPLGLVGIQECISNRLFLKIKFFAYRTNRISGDSMTANLIRFPLDFS